MNHTLKSLILSYDRQVPRYTSYPTAPQFKDITESGFYENRLASLDENARLSLYVHVPFCQRMCWYCGCHTKVTERYAPVEDYLHLMLREIDMLAGHIKAGQRVSHLHFGGGSPTMLRSVDFEKFMDRLHKVFMFADDAELAMEVDPRGVTEGRVATYAKAGINRISLGVQDFNEKVMESVNRPQPFFVTYDAVNLLRSYGIDKINVDFMYGLPYQTPETFGKSLDMLKIINPDRVAVFGYAHVPWLKKHMRLLDDKDLPDNALRYDLNEIAYEKLTGQGYVPIGIDHFARMEDSMVAARTKKQLRRNFQGYTTDNADALLGIGASSIGKFPQGFTQNAVAMPQYREKILAGELPVLKFRDVSQDDLIRGAVIEQLMCYFTCDLASVCKKFGVSPEYFAKECRELQRYVDDGVLEIDRQNVLSINPQARGMVRIIASAFDAYLPPAAETIQRHARAV